MNQSTLLEPATKSSARRRRHPWRWLSLAALLLTAALAAIGLIIARRIEPILKARIIETLSSRFNSRVELDQFHVSFLRGLEVSGDGLRIFPPPAAHPDGALATSLPRSIIAVRHFYFHASLRALYVKPARVDTVHVSGLEVHIPLPHLRLAAASPDRSAGPIDIAVDHILCDDSRLIIDTADPRRQPRIFVLQRLVLQRIAPDSLTPNGPANLWRYDATLINAIPPGNIHTAGTFGPWNNQTPGDSPLAGHYTFDHADLSSIKGIAGILSSTGDFRGQLNRIDVTGATDTPAFSLDTANQPLPLRTRFHVIVDGTTGDTTLDPVQARLRNSAFTCRGTIVNLRGQGHVIDLDVDVPAGNLQDFLALAIKTRPVYLTALINTHAKVHIHPGKQSVMQKLSMQSTFTLRQIHFTNPAVQTRLESLSMRAQGRPAEAPAPARVDSQMTGRFVLNAGRIDFSNLDYNLPGADIQFTGLYSLDGEQFDFHGKVRTQAHLSEMVSSWWKQLLLKPVDGFFAKNGAGTEIPIHVSGTRSEPQFGLDLDRLKPDRLKPAPAKPGAP